jgi:ferrochelatase
MKKAVLMMAHGAPNSPDEVEEYVLHIRHGRPLPADQMQIIKDRYAMVGGSPLQMWTGRQADGLAQSLGDEHPVYVGMRHSRPFIAETVARMRQEGVEAFVALCMAPQFSTLTVGAYKQALDEAIGGTRMAYSLIESYCTHPGLVRAFSTRAREVLDVHPRAFPVFTAHSLPERVIRQGDSYDQETKETARLVADSLQLRDWLFAYQSQGMTTEKWLGPTVEERILELDERGVDEMVVIPIGFVCDHVEILYDIDIYFRQLAMDHGIRLYRSPSLNDTPEFIDLIATLVRERI